MTFHFNCSRMCRITLVLGKSLLAILIVPLFWSESAISDTDSTIRSLRLPPGFQINVYASGINAPRQLAVAPNGTVFVGSRGGFVYALRDMDGDGMADQYKQAGGFRAPNGVALHQGDLYIGDISNVLVLSDAEKAFFEKTEEDKRFETVLENLPESTHHGYRYLRIHDDRLYISLGVPCNVCIPQDPELTGTIRSYSLQGEDPITHAYGVRNSVGFDWDPQTDLLWFTDNGRDWLGDDLPSDEVNRIEVEGQHFGFPFCHQGNFEDPDFGNSCDNYEPPVLLTGPHVANLGIKFPPTTMFPESYGNRFLVALHGSWNRSVKIGYAVYMAELDENRNVKSYEPFIEGWLDSDENVSGRPVDIAFLPDGAMLLSDDHSGTIYRVTYSD